jgi:hypothetical protein
MSRGAWGAFAKAWGVSEGVPGRACGSHTPPVGVLVRWTAFVALLLGILATSSANAAPAVTFNVGLQPKKLGKSTTVSIGFEVPTVGDTMPPALRSLSFKLPAGMGLAGSSLGVATCSTKTLVDDGASGCPTDSAMGSGSGTAEAAFGSEIVDETGRVYAFMTEPHDENTTMLYYFDGRAPVIAPLAFSGELLAPGLSPISELALKLPLIAALPGTPDTAIVSMKVSLGPKNLTYYKEVGHRRVGYKPVGMALPATCPKGGFLFSAYFVFVEGAHVSIVKKVACP